MSQTTGISNPDSSEERRQEVEEIENEDGTVTMRVTQYMPMTQEEFEADGYSAGDARRDWVISASMNLPRNVDSIDFKFVFKQAPSRVNLRTKKQAPRENGAHGFGG